VALRAGSGLGGCAFDAGSGVSDDGAIGAVGSNHYDFVESAVDFVRSIDGIEAFAAVNVAVFDGNGTATEESTGVAWSTGLAPSFRPLGRPRRRRSGRTAMRGSPACFSSGSRSRATNRITSL